jgi:1-phosphatidylinositol-4-phosphate 5-kinase
MDLDLKQHLYVGEQNAIAIRDILSFDSIFLKSLGIIDYSLLIGIHFVEDNDDIPNEVDEMGSSPSDCGSWSAEDSIFVNTYGAGRARDSQAYFAYMSPLNRVRRPFCRILADGGVLSTDLTQIYYFGIIDFLQQYDFGKKAERFVKVVFLGKDREGLSVQSPHSYQTRFLDQLSNIFE